VSGFVFRSRTCQIDLADYSSTEIDMAFVDPGVDDSYGNV